jgi:signal transduction histidine kinase
MSELKFKISSGLKTILGKELITDDNIAVFELVKNSYDAHASEVTVTFENIYSDDARIIISDNGKGMTLEDIKEKWLFVAYSAKKEGTEDIGYRDKIYQDRAFAGAKGIGRFSCDRLGACLTMITTPYIAGSDTHEINVDWNLFEQSALQEFDSVAVTHKRADSKLNPYLHGTTLIISNLRNESRWNRKKLLNLKDSLSKLINPFDEDSDETFSIKIAVEDESTQDKKEKEYRNQVNGPVKSILFEVLSLKTTKLVSSISKDGETITTTLLDGGHLIYKLQEKNSFNYLKSINSTVYFLNQKAKINFKNKMGFSSRQFGSIFVYKNGFRVFPFGEPQDDSFGLEQRKRGRRGSYLGINELIGVIKIEDHDDTFIETSSRDSGFIINNAFNALNSYLVKNIVLRLERYVIQIRQWGLGLQDLESYDERLSLKEKIIHLIARVSETENVISLEYDDNIEEVIDSAKSDSGSTQSMITNLRAIASKSPEQSEQIIKYANQLERSFKELKQDIISSDRQLTEVKKAIEEKETQNLFLQSVKSQEFQEIINLLHQVGIASNTIDNYMIGITSKLNRGKEISPERLRKIVETISFENRKILSVSRFATKANFKLNAEIVELDINNFLYEYVTNVAKKFRTSSRFSIDIKRFTNKEFILKHRPLELIILIDNLISNAQKAQATLLEITVDDSPLERLIVAFKDNGIGIKKENLQRIFDYGYTTTSGSGLGLGHIKEILAKLRATFEVDSKLGKGTTFTIKFEK